MSNYYYDDYDDYGGGMALFLVAVTVLGLFYASVILITNIFVSVWPFLLGALISVVTLSMVKRAKKKKLESSPEYIAKMKQEEDEYVRSNINSGGAMLDFIVDIESGTAEIKLKNGMDVLKMPNYYQIFERHLRKKFRQERGMKS
ncbi:MAG TPA: hypothetical protein GX734_04495 [Clostridiaceae bacterium]|jgi:hypothetical protein|nr:hypothetical protein [Clostridiaceae bacterium]